MGHAAAGDADQRGCGAVAGAGGAASVDGFRGDWGDGVSRGDGYWGDGGGGDVGCGVGDGGGDDGFGGEDFGDGVEEEGGGGGDGDGGGGDGDDVCEGCEEGGGDGGECQCEGADGGVGGCRGVIKNVDEGEDGKLLRWSFFWVDFSSFLNWCRWGLFLLGR